MSKRKNKTKKPVDYFARNKKSRNRGYRFEHWLVQKIESYATKWHARRLGGTSTNMPDVLAVNNQQSKMFALEAKSAMDVKRIYIPLDEIQRCVDMLTMFALYKDRRVILSFKFSIAKGRPIYYHFEFPSAHFPYLKDGASVYCMRDGHGVFEAGPEYTDRKHGLPAFSLDSLGVFQTPQQGY